MTTISRGTLHASTSRDKAGRSFPYYVLHRDRVEQNILDMKLAFEQHYGNFMIAYSFKTNYLRQIIEEVAARGGMAEVVSPYELSYALKLGLFQPNRIVYNGVTPDARTKFALAAQGGIVNVDNIAEFQDIANVAYEKSVPIKLGVRVNFEISNGLCSRFGVDIESDEFTNLMELLTQDDLVSFGGFHCHIGTARPPKFWIEKVETMIDLAKKYGAKYIDLGGGMYGPMIEELATQFSGYAGDFNEYAEPICSRMKEAFPEQDVMLIIEPGTALVGNTMDLYCHVTDVKNVRGQTYITVDTCSNHLGMICECRVIPTTLIKDKNSGEIRTIVHDATIAGCTCLEFDYIRKGFDGDVAIGDMILFENVGAYSIGASRQFIVARPMVVDAETGEILRQREKPGDMFWRYIAADE